MIEPRDTFTHAGVAAHYDDLDRFYRELWGEHLHHGLWLTGREAPETAVDQLIAHAVEAAAIERGARVCDVGCGYGGTSRWLSEHLDAKVIGLTLSQRQYHYAVERVGGACYPQFQLGKWEENRFEAEAFDAIVSFECLSHVPDKALFFGEIQRVLRPGGTAAITAWLTCDNPRGWQIRHLLEPICREGRLAGMPSFSEVASFADAAGLRVRCSEDLSRQVGRTWSICLWRVLLGILTRADYRSFLWKRPTANWVFLLTLWRIRAAYWVGAMKYGLFSLEKPA